MHYTIEKAVGKETAYMQLYRQLKKDIVDGVYKYGDKLPSKRLVAAECGVSVITVEHTYNILLDEGYLESRERSGYFIVYKDDNFFGRYTELNTFNEGKSVELPDLGVHQFPFSIYAKTVRKVLAKYGEGTLGHSPRAGSRELRSAIAAYLARSRGINVQNSQIIVGSGAEYLYGLIVQLLGREKIIAVENPSYEKIRAVYEANGITVEPLAMGKEGIISAQLQSCKASVLHVTPFNSYPTGITATASKRREYIRWAQARKGYIIEDDFASEFSVSSKAEDTVFNMEEKGCVIYVNTFSKTIAPSMRVGYMVLPEKLQQVFQERLGFYSCTVPLFEQYVLAELLNNGDFERHINRVRRKLRQEIEKMP